MPSDTSLPDLGMLTGQLMRAIQKELFAALAEQGHPDVSPRHGLVLAHLDPEGVRATDLAERIGQHKQIVGTIVDELVRLGYVRREPDPADGRAKLVVPTDRGQDEIAKARAILATIERRHEESLGADAYADFKRTLVQVTNDQRSWRAHSAMPDPAHQTSDALVADPYGSGGGRRRPGAA
ncbi:MULTISPECIES: MarR family winged helix-turn-helix transcriptional regulator [unclassified Pseudofrankia]|uniref:MarR family winged helix-turn-helix transcriptional regulator n=1 Tax=unclassified Pseudofrankia TaxID=2994372 RepID=UPI0009F20235|nr:MULTISPECIES: MarR family winged helix-turn-helix transcriptional regulator [unclassified Pseudofrankia]MDT3442485.1 MarR family winged helix-turn-helix transcriptional regulator [Pseudofrankia sp. BMG5.37]